MTRAVAAFAMLCAIGSSATMAQHAGHRHPPQHEELHQKFYQHWMRPDDRRYSCCNKEDCQPAEARRINGQWHVLREADGKWLPVPLTQIETERDSPDGRNHACFQPPQRGETVFCFLPAAGG